MTGNLTSFAAAVASTDGGVPINTREKEGDDLFNKRKAPNEPFTHAPGCRIVAVDPGAQIPCSEIRGVWEARWCAGSNTP
jgi:hypothetical protein